MKNSKRKSIKIRKITGRVFLGLAGVLCILLTAVFVRNRIECWKDRAYFDDPPGQYVEVDGHKMHMYSEGEGDHTIVFMSGWGTVDPMYDFKRLYKELSDDYRIVVIEKFGYGYSDTVNGERDFDTILSQDREALEKAGITGPFVLCPHSLSGLEAELWAQKFPEEIEAIVGLDMTLGASGADDTDFMYDLTVGINKFLRWSGIIRFSEPEEYLSDEENRRVLAISCRSLINDNVCNEVEHICEAQDEINDAPLPAVPTIQYISGVNASDDIWVNTHRELVDASVNGQFIQLDCGHYVHRYEYERIADDMKIFLNGLS